MAMNLIKKTNEYKIFKRGDERFAVQDATGKPVNGEEKVNILLAEELIKVTLPGAAPAEEAPAEEAPAEEFFTSRCRHSVITVGERQALTPRQDSCETPRCQTLCRRQPLARYCSGKRRSTTRQAA